MARSSTPRKENRSLSCQLAPRIAPAPSFSSGRWTPSSSRLDSVDVGPSPFAGNHVGGGYSRHHASTGSRPMTDHTIDPLALGQRVVAVLETGLRTATYKLATLMALVDHSVEYLPDNPNDQLTIPITSLAERVLETYWRQVVPLQGFGQLRQSSQPNARVLRAVQRLRDEAAASHIASPAVARERLQPAYSSAIADIALTLAQQPLHRLQRVTGAVAGPTFLYDDSWLHDHVSWRTINENGGAITLYPGVASGLARLSGLLKPTLEILWIQDVVKLNAGLAEEVQDVAGHLFGRERISLKPIRSTLLDALGRDAYTAAPDWHRAVPSTMCSLGHASRSMDWPISCRRASAATPTSQTLCRLSAP